MIESHRTVYGGSIASGKAVLAGDAGNIDEADHLFQVAEWQFKKALELVDKYPQLTIRKDVNKRLELNERRSRSFLRTR